MSTIFSPSSVQPGQLPVEAGVPLAATMLLVTVTVPASIITPGFPPALLLAMVESITATVPPATRIPPPFCVPFDPEMVLLARINVPPVV